MSGVGRVGGGTPEVELTSLEDVLEAGATAGVEAAAEESAPAATAEGALRSAGFTAGVLQGLLRTKLDGEADLSELAEGLDGELPELPPSLAEGDLPLSLRPEDLEVIREKLGIGDAGLGDLSQRSLEELQEMKKQLELGMQLLDAPQTPEDMKALEEQGQKIANVEAEIARRTGGTGQDLTKLSTDELKALKKDLEYGMQLLDAPQTAEDLEAIEEQGRKIAAVEAEIAKRTGPAGQDLSKLSLGELQEMKQQLELGMQLLDAPQTPEDMKALEEQGQKIANVEAEIARRTGGTGQDLSKLSVDELRTLKKDLEYGMQLLDAPQTPEDMEAIREQGRKIANVEAEIAKRTGGTGQDLTKLSVDELKALKKELEFGMRLLDAPQTPEDMEALGEQGKKIAAVEAEIARRAGQA